jgi:hypothetical protein
MPENHSAEWCRGAVEELEDLAIAFETPSLRLLALECRNRAAKFRALLAEAEAREALQGSKEKMALSHIYEIASRQLAEPAGAGDAVALAKICTEVEALHLPSEASVPTAGDGDDDLHRQIQSHANIIACHLDFEELLMRELFSDKFGDKSMDDTLKAVVSLKQQLTQAAEVIAACRVELQGGLDNFDGCEINPSNYNDCDVAGLNAGYVGLFQTIENAHAAIAKWKEAQRG